MSGKAGQGHGDCGRPVGLVEEDPTGDLARDYLAKLVLLGPSVERVGVLGLNAYEDVAPEARDLVEASEYCIRDRRPSALASGLGLPPRSS